MAGDRISEAYEGKLSKIMQQNAKKRMDWFCDQINCTNVLDIGCSQGILPVLLGRKGINVIGVDNDQDSIAYAEELLSKESEQVQKCVKFICDDFLKLDFGDKKFNTIVMGEVLEHLENPLDFLKKASELLDANGELIVSVPFGINRHPDHKRTYYFYNFYSQVNQYFKVYDAIYMGKWVAFKAASQENDNISPLEINEDTFCQFEKAVSFLDEYYEKEKNTLKEKNNELLTTNNKLIEINNNFKGLEDKFIKAIKEKEEFFLKKLDEKEEFFLKKLDEKEEKYLRKVQEKDASITLLSSENAKSKKDIAIYKRKLKDSATRLRRVEEKYAILSGSKLGKLALKYWAFKDFIKLKLSKGKYILKQTAKKSKLLCKIVRKFKNTNEFEKELVKDVSPNISKNSEKSNIQEKMNAAQRRREFEKNTDTKYFESIKEILDKIPESNGGRYYEKHNFKIGIVADEFLFAAFKDAADFVFITPENWKKVSKETDFLLMVSAWRGLHNEWRGAAKENSPQRQLIYDIIEDYKNQNKVTVFYSKEDPPNYDVFLGIAKKCDYIFTTCVEVVENYKRDCNNENVSVLCFGINPLYHNPVGIKNSYKKEGAIFSGSWMTKYPDRLIDMKMLFDGVLESGNDLKIIDRNYNYLNSEIYRYPREYWEYISPSIDHMLLQKVHKLYNWALNINTVTASMTMFANRGYELQASGNILLSNYSVGVNNKLPMVYTVTDKSEIGQIMNAFSDEEVYNRQIDCIRSVMTGETAFDRVGQLIEEIGFKQNKNERTVLVVADLINDDIKEMFESQSYPFKTLISEAEFTQDILSQYDMVTFFNSSMDYDMFYIEDMINGFKYTDSSYITKDAYFDGENLVKGKEHDYVSVMKNKYATVFWTNDFTAEKLIELKDNAEIANGYSIDHFNFNSKKIKKEKQSKFKLSVIVPVYNNGKQLMGKAFASLQRSSMFKDMEILLIDDGSTDGYTDKLVKYYAKKYANVNAYLFADGGSGSASRPRNKGIELATAEYVTYLDPDNEAIYNGYSKLYDLSVKNDYDISVGNMLKLTTQILDAKYFEKFSKNYGSDIIENDTLNYMKKTKFSPMSIQAMVVKKSIIIDNHLTQPVGAAGQDTLFCWELFFNAKTIKAINVPIHIYYAAVEGSTVNNIGKRFFEKYYLIEEPRRKALEKYGALELYMEYRYNYYFVNWMLKKLSQAKEEEYDECEKIVYRMYLLYEDVYLKNSKVINEFVEKHSCKDRECGKL